MRIKKQSIENIIHSISLSDHLRRYIDVKRVGQNFSAICPFHQDKSPSLHIYSDHYYCFACKAHGNIIDYEIHRTGNSFPESAKNLAMLYNISLEYDESCNDKSLQDKFKDIEFLNRFLEERFNLYENYLSKDLKNYIHKQFSNEDRNFNFKIGYAKNLKNIQECKIPNTVLKQYPEFIRYLQEDIEDRLVFPLLKDNGRFLGFAVSKKTLQNIHEQTTKLETLAFDSLELKAPFRSVHGLIHWESARISANKQGFILLLPSINALGFAKKHGIENVVTFFKDHLDEFSIKILSLRVSRVYLFLPDSEFSISFLSKSIENILSTTHFDVQVVFVNNGKILENLIQDIANKNEKHRTHFLESYSQSALFKLTQLLIDKNKVLDKKTLIQTKILPIILKIQDFDKRQVLLEKLAQEFFQSSARIFESSLVNIKTTLTIAENFPASKVTQTKDPVIDKEDLNKKKSVLARTVLFYHRLLLSSKGLLARQYLQNRGIGEEEIKRWHLGFCPNSNELSKRVLSKQNESKILKELDLIRESQKTTKPYYDFFYGRIIIPICNHDGQWVALSGRVFMPNKYGKDQAKYVNSSESDLFSKSNILFYYYGAMDAIISTSFVIVVEGYMDCISLVNAGIKNVVAVMGTSLTKAHFTELSKLTRRILLCFDNDSAGQNAAQRTFIQSLQFSEISLEYMNILAGKDPDEFIKTHGAQAFSEIAKTKNIPLYEKVFAWIFSSSSSRETFLDNLNQGIFQELEKSSSLNLKKEIYSHVKEKYFSDVQVQLFKQIQPIISIQTEDNISTKISTVTALRWELENPAEFKFLLACTFSHFHTLPERLANIVLNKSSKHENNEKFCALALKHELSNTGFSLLLEMCLWMAQNQESYLSSVSLEEQKLSDSTFVLAAFAASFVKGLHRFNLHELLRDSAIDASSILRSKNIWDIKNLAYLRFHLKNVSLHYQQGALSSYISDTLLQIELDYIDSAMRTATNLHHNDEVSPYFIDMSSERMRRCKELRGR